LTAFQQREATRTKLLAHQRAAPDADGFTTVTRGGRVGPARTEEAQLAKEREKEKDKNRIGGDFYRFQTREVRKAKEGELKRKFAEDREKVLKMREGKRLRLE